MIKASGNAQKLISELKAEKKDFQVSRTTKSATVSFDDFKYMFADSHFSNKHLNLFQQIKKEVHNNIKNFEIIPPEIQRSKYFGIQEFEQIGSGEFLKYSDCLEFDINKAYYKALYHFKYISKEFYDKCVELPKNIRLALVGTLATQKTVFFYESGELKSYELKKDDTLRKVFFQLVEYVDRALDYFSKLAGDNFLFYWVDGIYLKNYDRAEYHKDLISYEFDLDFSTEKIKEVIVYYKSEFSTQMIVKKEDLNIKTFNLNNIFVNEQLNYTV
ncbi:unnamed protein product [marine sediment metagenome]|uniref:Uncharacterized protein n=1 Tax=marine sediment metagenome TaxID=412755 RepID=X0T094_9ZZZZ